MMAVQEENGLDDEYPWRFDGRLCYRLMFCWLD